MDLKAHLKEKGVIYIIFLCYFPLLFYTCVVFLYFVGFINQEKLKLFFGFATGYWKIVSAPFLSFIIMLIIVIIFSFILWKSIQKKIVLKRIAIPIFLLSFLIAFSQMLRFF